MVLDCSTPPKTRANDCLTQSTKGGLLDNIANEITQNHTGKRADLRAANTHNIVSKVGFILAKWTDTLLTARIKKQGKEMNVGVLIGSHTDSLALLGHARYESSMKRRNTIRPSLIKLTRDDSVHKIYQLRPFCLETIYNNSWILSNLQQDHGSFSRWNYLAEKYLQKYL